jgi:hypothetical protein
MLQLRHMRPAPGGMPTCSPGLPLTTQLCAPPLLPCNPPLHTPPPLLSHASPHAHTRSPTHRDGKRSRQAAIVWSGQETEGVHMFTPPVHGQRQVRVHVVQACAAAVSSGRAGVQVAQAGVAGRQARAGAHNKQQVCNSRPCTARHNTRRTTGGQQAPRQHRSRRQATAWCHSNHHAPAQGLGYKSDVHLDSSKRSQ